MVVNYEELFTQQIISNTAIYADKAAYIVNGKSTTYAEMYEMARHIASGLVEHIPSSALDNDLPVRICINLARNEHFIPCMLAVIMLHASYIPLDTATPDNRKKTILEDSGASYIINSNNLPELLKTPIIENLPDFRKPYSELYILYTSGTTGVPKGVSIPYKSFYNYIQTVTAPDNFNISDKSKILLFASINFDASCFEIYSALCWGGTLYIAQEEERKDVKLLYNLIRREKLTSILMPPSLLSVLPDFNFPSLETLITGGEAIAYNTVQRIISSEPKFRFINAYGPTEATIICTIQEMKEAQKWRNIGKMLPGMVGYVVKSDGTLAQSGEDGELLIGGLQLCNGYWNREDLNEKAFIDNPYDDPQGIAPRLYHSGDRVRLCEDGSYDYIERIDSQVKIHSYRIELQEITNRIEAHPRVQRAFTQLEVLGNDKHLVTYVSTIDKKSDLSDIREYLAKHVPHYMVPTFWNHVPQFELNINGKIDKTILVNKAWEESTKNTTSLNDNERILADEVARLIGVDDVNVDADLIDEIGLTSLQIMQIPQDLQLANFKVSVEDIYTHRTIRKCIKNHLHRICFWYNNPEEHPERPALIWICGHPSFGFCEEMVSKFTEKYNIFVIEGYHSILSFETEHSTVPVLNQLYSLLVTPVVENYDVKAILGFCLGGDQGLLLADTLFKNKDNKPLVVTIDGEPQHNADKKFFISINFPIFTAEQNHRREIIDFNLMSTFPNFHYNGPVCIVLSTIFDEIQTATPEEQANIPEYVMDFYRDRFKKMPQMWREEYPQADIIQVDCTHFECLHSKSCIEAVSNYVNKFA